MCLLIVQIIRSLILILASLSFFLSQFQIRLGQVQMSTPQCSLYFPKQRKYPVIVYDISGGRAEIYHASIVLFFREILLMNSKTHIQIFLCALVHYFCLQSFSCFLKTNIMLCFVLKNILFILNRSLKEYYLVQCFLSSVNFPFLFGMEYFADRNLLLICCYPSLFNTLFITVTTTQSNQRLRLEKIVVHLLFLIVQTSE